MKERKNIDRLFQEKFKDFEAHPSDRVWQNIASAKAQKEERKVLPIWWRLGGIAAALLLLLALGNTLLNSNADSTTPLVNTETKDTTLSKETPVATDLKEANITPEQSNNPKTQVTTTATQADFDQNPVATSNTDSNISAKGRNPLTTATSVIATTEQEEQTSNNGQNQNLRYKTPVEETRVKAVQTTSAIAQTPVIEETITAKSGVSEVSQDAKNNTAIDSNQDLSSDRAVAVQNENEQQGQDNEKVSLIDVAEEINRNKTEEDAIASTNATQPSDKWRVGAVAAPVYYGDFGGSGIDPQFKDNSKSGDVNLSYGVQVSYAVSDKIKLRTGVSNVDLSYGTNDISFRPDIAATKLAGVAPNRNGKFLSVSDKVGPQALQQSDFQGGGSSVSNGSINQQIGYIEVPLEAVYVLSNKRLGVEVIGGVSTLFVNDNEIAIESDGLRTPIGASSSLNDVSFTTNIGVGLNYKVTEKIDINMEPTLKYQLNAFEASAGNFKPYYVGLYTGVSYRF